MSLYNIMNGVNPSTFFILPMLGEKHPDEYPRFRDCFVSKEENEIIVFTRVGGPNRGCGYGEEELQKHPNFLRDFDNKSDSTYAAYVFSVPEKFRADFDLILANKLKDISENYKKRLYAVFPKLAEYFDKIFSENPESPKEQ